MPSQYPRAASNHAVAGAPAGPKSTSGGGHVTPEELAARPTVDANGRPIVRTDREDLADTWIAYKEHKRDQDRNVLMEAYLHLVRYNAERVYAKLPNEVDVDDLMSAGIFGLMDAIDHFDFSKGVKFETYCARRIQGAILDELRSMDWVPRLVRSRSTKLDSAQKSLEVSLGRQPTHEELAEKMDVDMEEFGKIYKDAQATSIVSLSRKWYETDSNKDVREIDVLEDKRTSNPLSDIQRKDLKELMSQGLSRAERLIVTLYYFEEMTMKEIGATLDLSESRVSQMHSSILARLRAQMVDRKREMAETAVG